MSEAERKLGFLVRQNRRKGMEHSEVVVEGQAVESSVSVTEEDMQQDIPLNEQKIKFGTGTTVKLGQHRADDVDIYYELHGHGPTKLLFIMGKRHSLKSRKIFDHNSNLCLISGFQTSSRAWKLTVSTLSSESIVKMLICKLYFTG